MRANEELCGGVHVVPEPVREDESAYHADLQYSCCRTGEGTDDEQSCRIVSKLHLWHVNSSKELCV